MLSQLKASVFTRALKRKNSKGVIINVNAPINGETINAIVNNGFDKIDDEEEPESSNVEDLDKREPSIGLEWLKFIKKYQSIFHPLSPEANNIIRSGNAFGKPTVLRNVADPADLHVIGVSVNIGGCKGYFIQGQPVLMSMTQQLIETGLNVPIQVRWLNKASQLGKYRTCST
ncbi:hypothetical protein MFLAVUS_004411 [Mucor flavus]|uniref:Uncharacterized protein n=1 Tax=Mucor flavus TaxID=439312 RepID=A0ABP9YVV9_9FUNG